MKALASEGKRSQIEAAFATREKVLGRSLPLPQCDDEQLLCLKSMYAYSPISDLVSYTGEFYLECVKWALKARKEMPWGGEISEDHFFNDTLPCRINNEDLRDYRGLFYGELAEKVKGLSMKEAALTVNIWCFQKATYQSTNERTLSPLGVINNAYGRCGEESTLLTAALRSVGIPARQCYAPRWSHCDDNHAWVEAWLGDGWHFLGACEPEAAFDRGWFTAAAKRAMLIHARVFASDMKDEVITTQTPVLSLVNILGHYAPTKELKVRIKDKSGAWLEGIEVRFQLINYSELFSIATVPTDKDGRVTFRTGFGTIFIHVSFPDGTYLVHKVDVDTQDEEVVLCSCKAVAGETGESTLDFHAPPLVQVEEAPIPEELLKAHSVKQDAALAIRQQYEATFARGKKAEEFAGQFPEFKESIAQHVSEANGNHSEIEKFLLKWRETGDLEDRVWLLDSLPKKDMSDTSAEAFESHLEAAKPYKNLWPKEIYKAGILCPRIHLEPIRSYRSQLADTFTDSEKAAFKASPLDLWRWVNHEIKDCGPWDYPALTGWPVGTLEWKVGSLMSRKVLFVALCRTMGIPARLRTMDLALEYAAADGLWHTVEQVKASEEEPKLGTLTLKRTPGEKLEYFRHFTIARLKNGVYETLNLDTNFEEDSLDFTLEAGDYRVTTANRMSNGDILAMLYFGKVEQGGTTEISIALRKPVLDISHAIKLPELELETLEGNGAIAVPEKPWLLSFLEEGGEPTEHLFNEMLEQKTAFKTLAEEGRVVFVVKDKSALENRTLKKVLAEMPITMAHLGSKDFKSTADGLFTLLNTPDRKLPLAMAVSGASDCFFASSGYNVGIGELLLKQVQMA